MKKQQQKKVAGIGELLWDVFPQGKQMGGAPCNFAFHAMQAGFEVHVVSAVGKDPDGEEILELMNQLGLDQIFVQSKAEFPTGTVTVELTGEAIPEYIIHENVAWDHIGWTGELETLAGEVDAVCFGSLAQRTQVSRDTIRLFLEATRPECLRVYDINLRQSFKYRVLVAHFVSVDHTVHVHQRLSRPLARRSRQRDRYWAETGTEPGFQMRYCEIKRPFALAVVRENE